MSRCQARTQITTVHNDKGDYDPSHQKLEIAYIRCLLKPHDHEGNHFIYLPNGKGFEFPNERAI